MSFLFLIALFVAFGVPPQPITEPATALRLLCVALGIIVLATFAQAIGVSTRRRLDAGPEQRSSALRRYYRLRLLHDFLMLAVFAAMLHGAGWATLIQVQWGLKGWVLIDELLLLAPYLIAEVLSLVSFYYVERKARESRAPAHPSAAIHWTLGKYINFQLRHHIGVFLAGSLTISAARDVIDWAYPAWESTTWSALVFGISLSVGMLIFSPILLRFVWGTSVLRPGTLRTELETIAKRIGFRYSNILVWNTGGVVVNAAVTGIVPQVRYVLLSDALIQQLSPKETAAVFGHEVGHVKHHHLSYYLLFILLSILFAGLLGQWIQIQTQPWFQSFDHPWMEWFAKYTPYDAILLVPYVFFVFGMLSRRCERQADVYGSRAVSMIEPDLPPLEQILADQGFRVNEDPSSAGVLLASENVALSHERKSPRVTANGAKIFVQSLEKVAELNGMSRSAPNWRHGSIEQRIEFLERVAQDPELADRYDRAVRRFRYTLALTLMAGIVSLAWATNESFFQGETAPVKTADNVK